MHHSVTRLWLSVFVLAALTAPARPLPGQERAADAANAARPARPARPRKLAPGVIKVIRPKPKEEETFSGPRELIELVHGTSNLNWTPHHTPKSTTLHEIVKEVIFRRQIWHLEFGFKPLRMIYVNVPQPDGTLKRQLVWYLYYYVKNNGDHQNPVAKKDEFGHETYSTAAVDQVRRRVHFFPNFILEDHEQNKRYLDQVIPVAVAEIQRREDPAIRLYNTVEISQKEIPVSSEREDRRVWGAATWTGVDPRTDFLSIYIRGLTNAYRWEDPPGAYRPGNPPGSGRRFTYKTLKLHFWRPGDAVLEHEGEVRHGIPLLGNEEKQQQLLGVYGVPERVDHLWVYR